jgi:hypothetical protein
VAAKSKRPETLGGDLKSRNLEIARDLKSSLRDN